MADGADFDLSVDLLTATCRLHHFLRLVDRVVGALYDPQICQNAVRRYEQFWLPMKADPNLPDALIPPVDCQWIWYLHMLNPKAYVDDCNRLVSTVIDHHLPSHNEIDVLYEQSVAVWGKFSDGQEPYDWQTSLQMVEEQKVKLL